MTVSERFVYASDPQVVNQQHEHIRHDKSIQNPHITDVRSVYI